MSLQEGRLCPCAICKPGCGDDRTLSAINVTRGAWCDAYLHRISTKKLGNQSNWEYVPKESPKGRWTLSERGTLILESYYPAKEFIAFGKMLGISSKHWQGVERRSVRLAPDGGPVKCFVFRWNTKGVQDANN